MRDLVRVAGRAAGRPQFLRAALIFFCAAGISLVFLAAGAMAGSASTTARPRFWVTPRSGLPRHAKAGRSLSRGGQLTKPRA